MNAHIEIKTRIVQAWRAGVDAAGGMRATRAALAADGIESITRLLAVGKAAAAMCAGALDVLAADGKALVVTKYGHADATVATHPGIELIEAGHPLPDENSLRAGRAVDEFVRATAADEELVMLLSGGASALAELLPATVDLRALQAMNAALLASGYAIADINAARMRVSGIKGGKLLRNFRGQSARVYAISDVPGDDIDIIGGGLGARGVNHAPLADGVARLMNDMNLPVDAKDDARDSLTQPAFGYRARIVASNKNARDAAAEFLRAHDVPVNANAEALNRDMHVAAQALAAGLIAGPPGATVWGGESTVLLPPKPGVGGRNMSLALALAKEIRGRNIAALVAGSDGSDGPTAAAGALIDGDTFDAASGAARALACADAGTYLARIAALFKPGPTGTNVMDLAVAIKWA